MSSKKVTKNRWRKPRKSYQCGLHMLLVFMRNCNNKLDTTSAGDCTVHIKKNKKTAGIEVKIRTPSAHLLRSGGEASGCP